MLSNHPIFFKDFLKSCLLGRLCLVIQIRDEVDTPTCQISCPPGAVDTRVRVNNFSPSALFA